jgi:hypothetical protein
MPSSAAVTISFSALDAWSEGTPDDYSVSPQPPLARSGLGGCGGCQEVAFSDEKVWVISGL